MKIDWNRKYTTIAVYAVIVGTALLMVLFAFLNFDFFIATLGQLNSILSPIYLGIIMAYLFNPVLKFCEKRIFRFKAATKRQHITKRALSLVLTYIIILIILTIFLLLVIPQVYLSCADLASKMGGYIDSTLNWINDFLSNSKFIGSDINNIDDVISKMFEIFDINMATFGSKLQEIVTNSSNVLKDYFPKVVDYFKGITNGFINTIIGVIFSVYFLASKEKLTAQTKKLLRAITSQKTYNSTLELANYTDKTFGGYITGKLLDSLIVGILMFIICGICKMPYTPLVSVLVGVTNVIPIVGPFLGAIPGTFIIFIVDPIKAFWFIVINVVVQQLDGNVICPKILGETTGLSALWVMVSITVMGGLWGLFGMVISVPIFAVLYTLVKLGVEKRLAKKGAATETVEYYAAVEDRTLSEDDNTPSFAAKLSRMTAEIADNHFGERIRKFKQKHSKKKKGNAPADESSENPDADSTKPANSDDNSSATGKPDADR